MSSYEEYIMKILMSNKIDFEREKTFKDLQNGLYRYDFYLSDKKCIIEVDGEYHFKQIRSRQDFLKQKENDRRKNSYCLANKITLYRIPYWDIKKIKTPEDIFQDKYIVKTKWHNDYLINK